MSTQQLQGTTYEGPASKFDDSRFINANTLRGLGEVTVTIKEAFYLSSGFKFENQQSLKDDKLCLRFTNGKKVLMLNKTNIRTLQTILDPMCKNWVGRKVKIFTDPSVRFAGKAVGGVVVKNEVIASDSPNQPSSEEENLNLEGEE